MSSVMLLDSFACVCIICIMPPLLIRRRKAGKAVLIGAKVESFSIVAVELQRQPAILFFVSCKKDACPLLLEFASNLVGTVELFVKFFAINRVFLFANGILRGCEHLLSFLEIAVRQDEIALIGMEFEQVAADILDSTETPVHLDEVAWLKRALPFRWALLKFLDEAQWPEAGTEVVPIIDGIVIAKETWRVVETEADAFFRMVDRDVNGLVRKVAIIRPKLIIRDNTGWELLFVIGSTEPAAFILGVNEIQIFFWNGADVIGTVVEIVFVEARGSLGLRFFRQLEDTRIIRMDDVAKVAKVLGVASSGSMTVTSA